MSRTVYYDWQGNEIDPPHDEPVPMTNADRIRTMTDEELAKMIEVNGVCPPTRTYLYCMLEDGCTDCWLEWLKSPVKVDNGN